MVKKRAWMGGLTLLISATALAGNAEDTDARIDAVMGVGSHSRYHHFLDTMQYAIRTGDKQKVAGLVSYPLKASVAGKTLTFSDRHALVKAYDKVFTPRLKNIIVDQKYGDLFVRDTGVMVGPQGELWFSGICLTADCAKYTLKIIRINN